MGITYNPRTITDGLVLCLDAANPKSYPGSGTTWTDLSGRGNTGTLVNGVGYNSGNLGSLVFDGVDDYISTAYSIGTVSQQSISCWISKTNLQYSLILASSALLYYGLEIYPTTIYVNIGTNTYGQVNYDINGYQNIVFSYDGSQTGNSNRLKLYLNGILQTLSFNGNIPSSVSDVPPIDIGKRSWSTRYSEGRVSQVSVYNRALSAAEIQQNYNAVRARYEKGGIDNPFSSPTEARILGYTSGDYYFKSGSMSSPQLLEFQRDYYENRGWVCVFRSPYRSTATTNRIGLNIPMGGLLVQRDALDLRAAVYWSTPITYNAVGGTGNNTADSGYSPRRVILGGSGGHGIFATNQNQCSWGTATGAIGAGWDGSTCGSFPNDLVWGTGRSDTATYENRSGIWSHWITWN